VSVIVVVTGDNVPEVPVMVIGYAPATVVEATANVTTLVAVAGLVANAAVTPVGRLDAARVTLPANGLTSVTVIVSVPLAPGAIDKAGAEGASVKLPVGAAVTVSVMEVVTGVSVPEVPVMVIGYAPATVVEATVSVTTLVAVAGLVPNAAVTPAGIPDAARVTEPAKGLTSVTVIVSVALAP
jgi:hypothetical protein